jgi:glycosyltransferase 2 family protein
VLTSTGQAVPSSPGYVGVYQAAATFALNAFGVDLATAFAISVITWAVTYATLVALGLVALWTGGYTFADVLSAIKGQGSSASSVPIAPEPLHLAPDP